VTEAEDDHPPGTVAPPFQNCEHVVGVGLRVDLRITLTSVPSAPDHERRALDTHVLAPAKLFWPQTP